MYLNIAKMLDEQKITVALMVPSVLSYMERFFSELKLDSMRYSIFCGEALLQDLCEGWSRCIPNAHIQNTYGPTEATVMCLYYDWFIQQSRTDSVNGIVPIGKSMPGINIVVLDDDLVPVASGNKGELCLCGEQVTDRYWNDIDKTQTSFIEISYLDVKQKFYRTGDMCYLNKDGNYIFCGRKDFQIKIDGHRIELEEIEQVAREFTGDNLAAVVPVEDIQGGVSLTLYIKKLDIEPVELQSYMSTRLPGYMLPKKVIMLEEIPLNTNGKVDRKVLSKL
jgi:acyl-coenzyme A synthetase/AMP-(fatty) acid ligase